MTNSRRFALQLEYDGAAFVGWQRQRAGGSVQEALEGAAGRLAGGTIAATGAGRTDAGVHAEGQVAHLDLPDRFDAATVRNALNFHLKPHPLTVVRAAEVPPAWHARFDAIRRCYRYVILNRPSRPAIRRGHCWHVPRALEVAAMAEGAARLVGRHDFTSFRAAACQAKSPVRTLDRLTVALDGDLVIVIAEARSFLHHQVRNITGTLKLVGEGRWSPAMVADALAQRNRAAAGPTAPPDGLFLTRVDYVTNPFDSVGDDSTMGNPSIKLKP